MHEDAILTKPHVIMIRAVDKTDYLLIIER